MKIISLKAENVKRLTAVEIVPQGDASVVIVSGKNAQGKSSVLDAIAYALGGQALVPAEPIRTGEARAEITVDLGAYIVTRTFTRDTVYSCGQFADDQPHVHDATCPTGFGPTRSYLTVKSPDGAKYPSPQALLDKLLGQLTFDPLAFARMDPKAQADTLRRVAGLDFTELNARAQRVELERREANKRVASLNAQVNAAPRYPDAPAEEVSVDTLSQELETIENLRRKAGQAEEAARFAQERVADGERKMLALKDKLTELRRQVTELERLEAELTATLEKNRTTAREAAEQARAAAAQVPDVTVIKRRLAEVEESNRRVRANRKHEKLQAELLEAKSEAQRLNDELRAIAEERLRLVQQATFPVEGLSVADDHVCFNGRPLAQASAAEQLRISVALGLALNPQLKVLLVRNGNDLDDDGLRQLGELAAAADAQVWVERIAGGDGGVTILIEDGAVRRPA